MNFSITSLQFVLRSQKQHFFRLTARRHTVISYAISLTKAGARARAIASAAREKTLLALVIAFSCRSRVRRHIMAERSGRDRRSFHKNPPAVVVAAVKSDTPGN